MKMAIIVHSLIYSIVETKKDWGRKSTGEKFPAKIMNDQGKKSS